MTREEAIKMLKSKMDGTVDTSYEWAETIRMAIEALHKTEAQTDTDEWCTDCAEYDHERHCCPRWNRVIRETLKDARPEIIRCRDCKHWGERGLCDKWDYYIGNGDFYCGCAERREG